jgi:hypothetical protein
LEESIAGHLGVNGVYEKLGKGNTKGSMVGPGGICRQRACFSLPGAFKTYTNLWEGQNQVDYLPIINEWGEAWLVPGPDEGNPWARALPICNVRTLSHIFSMSPELSLPLGCLR